MAMIQDWRVSTGVARVEVRADNWLSALAQGLPLVGLDLGAMARLVCGTEADGSATARDPRGGVEVRVEPLGSAVPPSFEMPMSSFAHLHAPQLRVASSEVAAPVGKASAAPVWAKPIAVATPVMAASTPAGPRLVAESPTSEAVEPRVEAWTPSVEPMPAAPRVEPWTPTLAPAPRPRPAPPAEDEIDTVRPVDSDDVATDGDSVATASQTSSSFVEPAPIREFKVQPPPRIIPPPPSLTIAREGPGREVSAAPRTAPLPAPRLEDRLEELFLRLGEILQAESPTAACAVALRLANELIPSDAGAVLIRTRAGDALRFRAALGPASASVLDTTIPLDRGIAGFVFQLGLAITIGDARADTRHYGRVDRVTGYQTRMLLAAPVRADDGGVYGVLELLNPARPFVADDLELASRVGATLGGLFQAIHQ